MDYLARPDPTRQGHQGRRASQNCAQVPQSGGRDDRASLGDQQCQRPAPERQHRIYSPHAMKFLLRKIKEFINWIFGLFKKSFGIAIYEVLAITPGRNRAWVNSNFGVIKKPN